jgi:hypothetical protein
MASDVYTINFDICKVIDEKLLISPSGRASFASAKMMRSTFWQKQKQPDNWDGAQRPRATCFSKSWFLKFLNSTTRSFTTNLLSSHRSFSPAGSVYRLH